MGIIIAITDSARGTLADQWKEIFMPGVFDEHTVVGPGVQKNTNKLFGVNNKGLHGVISNGSKIYVPDNTVAFIYSATAIENVITTPGNYEFSEGQDSIFSGGGIGKSILKQTVERVGYGGITADEKKIAYVNLREIRDIKFGTKGPQIYNDHYYGVDLEVSAFGSFTVKVVDPTKLITNFVPPNTGYYSFDDQAVRSQITSEFLQSFITALNQLSANYRVSQIPSHTNELSESIEKDMHNAGTWEERFGFKITRAAIESIELTEASKELVRNFSANKMSVKAYDDVSQQASNMAAQQKIAQGIEDHGLGKGGGMVFGMNMAQNMGMTAQQNVQPVASQPQTMSIDEQLESVKKMKELLDAGVLSQEEFDIKKKEIMGL